MPCKRAQTGRFQKRISHAYDQSPATSTKRRRTRASVGRCKYRIDVAHASERRLKSKICRLRLGSEHVANAYFFDHPPQEFGACGEALGPASSLHVSSRRRSRSYSVCASSIQLRIQTLYLLAAFKYQPLRSERRCAAMCV